MSGLPWIQVDANLPYHRKSIQLAATLGDDDAWRFLVRLWLWASQNEPTGIIRGGAAMLVVERVCGWKGEPQKLAAALVESGWLEVHRDGDELGLAIHDWADHQGAHIDRAERERSRVRNLRGTRGVRVQTAERTRTDRVQNTERTAYVLGETEKETEKEKERKATAEPPPPTSKIPVPVQPPKAPDDPLASGEAFFAAVQLQRAEAGLAREPPPRRLSVWWSEALMETNGDAARVVRAYQGFAQDKYWRDKSPPLPFAGFMSQWRKWDVPAQSVRTAPAA